MKHLLFICSWGQVRSVCGYYLFKDLYPCHYFGLSGDKQINHLNEWCTEADYIFVMSGGHVSYFQKYHSQYLPKIINLNIEDLWGDPNNRHLKKIMFTKVQKILNKTEYDSRLDRFDYDSIYIEPVKEYELKGLHQFFEDIKD